MLLRTDMTKIDREILDRVSIRITRSKKILMVVGAGISCNAGIPDFRSSNGLYNQAKQETHKNGKSTSIAKGKDIFDTIVFNCPESAAIFFRFMRKMKNLIEKAKPTSTHRFIRQLNDKNNLLRCYSQNIDGLEAQAGVPMGIDAKNPIIPLHGDMSSVKCTQCFQTYEWKDYHSNFFENGTAPECDNCLQTIDNRVKQGKRRTGKVGHLRPNIILYGEQHNQGEEIGKIINKDIRSGPDMLLIIGTSLQVPGIKKLVKDAATKVKSRKDGIVVLINQTPVSNQWSSLIDYHLQGDCDFWVDQIKANVRSFFMVQTYVSEKYAVTKSILPGEVKKRPWPKEEQKVQRHMPVKRICL